jgi:dimethylargininase
VGDDAERERAMTARRALVRRPGPQLADGIVTHVERRPVDVPLALRQWDGYVAALQATGWSTVEVSPADFCPDAVFVEDTMVVFRNLAVVSRPGALTRRPEVVDAEKTVESLGYSVNRVQPPGAKASGSFARSSNPSAPSSSVCRSPRCCT